MVYLLLVTVLLLLIKQKITKLLSIQPILELKLSYFFCTIFNTSSSTLSRLIFSLLNCINSAKICFKIMKVYSSSLRSLFFENLLECLH